MSKKILKYATAYALWIVDLGLAAWLFFNSRSILIGSLALFYKPGNFEFSKMVDLIHNVVMVILGLGWLAFSVIIEDVYRTGARKGNLFKSFARITGPLLLCVFAVDLILFWLQGISSNNLIRWLILTAELGTGLALVAAGRKNEK